MGETYVEALLEERDGYRRAGKTDRVREVDAELKRFGVEVGDGETEEVVAEVEEPEATTFTPPENAARPPARGRRR